jgi:hypothetical protein
LPILGKALARGHRKFHAGTQGYVSDNLAACHHPTAANPVASLREDSYRPLSFAIFRIASVVAMLLCSFCAMHTPPSFAQAAAPPDTSSGAGDLESIAQLLLENIQSLSEYRSNVDLPPIFQVPQHVIEAKVCDEPCNVSAAYVPREGIYLAANLDPIREPLDRSALLHELVHYLQQGHPKFAGLAPCERERLKEQEAYAIQNAYLASIDSKERAVFYAGDFDCEGDGAQR